MIFRSRVRTSSTQDTRLGSSAPANSPKTTDPDHATGFTKQNVASSASHHMPIRMRVAQAFSFPTRSSRPSRGVPELARLRRVPVLYSDSLASVAFAPDQLLLTLSLAGVVASAYSIWVGLSVALVLAIVVASYRQTVLTFPQGGDYGVVKKNLGKEWGLLAGTALLVDAILLLSIVLSTAAQFIVAIIPSATDQQPFIASFFVILLAMGAYWVPVKSVRATTRWNKTSWFGSLPTYLFLVVLTVMVIVGGVQYWMGILHNAPSADLTLPTNPHFADGLVGVGGAYLFARAFASGAIQLSGVSAISNGVATFPSPRARNAVKSFSVLAAASVLLTLAILWLARVTHMEVVDDPSRLYGGHSLAEYDPAAFNPVLAQLAYAIFGAGSLGFYTISAISATLMLTAAVVLFRSLPTLVGTLANDGFLPRQLHARADGRRSITGLLIFSTVSIAFLIAFNAQPARLIQLYIVGLFIALSLSQMGMIRHWNSLLRERQTGHERRGVAYSRALSIVGFMMTLTILSVVLATKFLYGVWLSLALIGVLFVLQRTIHHYYSEMAAEMALSSSNILRATPTRVHAIVVAPSFTQLTELTVATARASAPTTLELLSVAASEEDERRLRTGWESSGISVPLTLLSSPKRQITSTIVQHISAIRERRPQELVIVYVPHILVKHWWLSFMHNQVGKALRKELLCMPGVVVTLVPWQMSPQTKRERQINDPFRLPAVSMEEQLNQDEGEK